METKPWKILRDFQESKKGTLLRRILLNYISAYAFKDTFSYIFDVAENLRLDSRLNVYYVQFVPKPMDMFVWRAIPRH